MEVWLSSNFMVKGHGILEVFKVGENSKVIYQNWWKLFFNSDSVTVRKIEKITVNSYFIYAVVAVLSPIFASKSIIRLLYAFYSSGQCRSSYICSISFEGKPELSVVFIFVTVVK